ncbi:MAG: MATE family efflux transporter [Allobaculum sp.]
MIYTKQWLTHFNGASLKQILRIAPPNGMEDGIFQIVKVGLSSIFALFGTMQIAANGVAQSFWSLSALAGTVMGPVFITVIGRCMGQKDYQQATEWFSKLLKMALMISIVWNLATGLCVPLFLKLYALDAQTIQLVLILVVIHNVFNALAFPFSGALAAGLRACGDVKFTMIVSILCTIGVRLVFSYLFGVIFNWSVIGIAMAMAMDWTLRGIIFFIRLKSNRWQQMQVID